MHIAYICLYICHMICIYMCYLIRFTMYNFIHIITAGRRTMHMARNAIEAREWHRILAVRDSALDAARFRV